MINKCIFFFLFAFAMNCCFAQDKKIDSLKQQLTVVKQDTSRVNVLINLCILYRSAYPDSCLMTAEQALNLARKINFTGGELRAINWLGLANRDRGNYPQAFSLALKGLRLAKKHQSPYDIAEFHHLLGTCYTDFKDYKNAILNLQTAQKIEEKAKLALNSLNDLSYAYTLNNQLDSASFYAALSYQNKLNLKSDFALFTPLRNLGRIQMLLGNYDKALDYYWKSYEVVNKQSNNVSGYKAYIYNLVGEVYLKMNKIDSCIFYAEESLISNKALFQLGIRKIESYNLLVEAYKQKKDFKQAFENLELSNAAGEKLYGASNTQAIQTLLAQDQEQQKQSEIEKIAYQSQLKQFALLIGLGITLFIGFILYRNSKKEKKAKTVLENTLTELKSTQTQLIQSEKMASLGELTAGIAHEIQNPLNFVNNFSEVNTELIEELELEAGKGNLEEIKLIAKDIKENEQKINHHGKRADSIVKGMLQHSRSGSGVKEPTDINALADEYLRLAYHGLKAKDKSFNANMKTDFDPQIGTINMVPQDIGRVLLNMVNNAFYAVHEKQKEASHGFEPAVWLQTKRAGDKVEISVRDNGNGIPEKIKEKIFQPFFTTKPTGQGTGLGLSLGYDIVKAHGGEIKIITKEGEGSEFIILLPVV